MEFRSTQSRYVHFQGDVISNVSSGGVENSSHGVHLTGGSTGGLILSAGDETDISLQVRGKGTGVLDVGSSGAPITLGGSTSLFRGLIFFQDTAVTLPDIASTDAGKSSGMTTHAIAGVTTNSVILANLRNDTNSTAIQLVSAYASRSTAGEVHCNFIKSDSIAFAATTGTINFAVFRF